MKKLYIILFFRKPNINFSIERVFNTVLDELKDNQYINKICVKNYRTNPGTILLNMFYVYKNRGSVNHITGDIHYCTLFLPTAKTILTIHDLVLLKSNKGFKRQFFWFFWYYLPVRKAKYITCISETTKQELIKSVKCDPSKIIVIYNPVSNNYRFIDKEFYRKFPVILHIGTRSNKNLERVIQALNDIPCELRIIGNLDQNQLSLLRKYSINFSNVSNITDQQMVEEYIKCDIVSFPSTYEGFGMPIIEGQATGRVILTSNVNPMAEIAKDSCILVDPFNVDSIRQGFLSIINDDQLRKHYIKKGHENISRFSQSKIAAEYLNLYSMVK